MTNVISVLLDILDSVFLRPGRIDRRTKFPPPGPETCSPDTFTKDPSQFAENVCARERRQHVTQENFEFAMVKVLSPNVKALKKRQEANTFVNKL